MCGVGGGGWGAWACQTGHGIMPGAAGCASLKGRRAVPGTEYQCPSQPWGGGGTQGGGGVMGTVGLDWAVEGDGGWAHLVQIRLGLLWCDYKRNTVTVIRQAELRAVLVLPKCSLRWAGIRGSVTLKQTLRFTRVPLAQGFNQGQTQYR